MATLESLLSKLPLVASVQLTLKLTKHLVPAILQHLNCSASAPNTPQPATLINSVSLGTAHCELHSLELNISCTHPAVATQLRHSHTGLRERLNSVLQQEAELCGLLRSQLQNPRDTVTTNVTTGHHTTTNQPVTISKLHISVFAGATPSTTNTIVKPSGRTEAVTHTRLSHALRTLGEEHNMRASAELIEQFARQINDPELSESLQRLASTLLQSERSD